MFHGNAAEHVRPKDSKIWIFLLELKEVKRNDNLVIFSAGNPRITGISGTGLFPALMLGLTPGKEESLQSS